MSSNIINEDLRSVKTKKALCDAMLSQLKKHSFRKITIKGICEEAFISRAAFYAHFVDKYDLLKYWMSDVWMKYFAVAFLYEDIEATVNCLFVENTVVLKNLVYDADNETFVVLYDFMISTMGRSSNDEINTKNVVLSNIYAGGLITYFLWQINHKFPPDIPPMNEHLYEIIKTLREKNKDETEAVSL